MELIASADARQQRRFITKRSCCTLLEGRGACYTSQACMNRRRSHGEFTPKPHFPSVTPWTNLQTKLSEMHLQNEPSQVQLFQKIQEIHSAFIHSFIHYVSVCFHGFSHTFTLTVTRIPILIHLLYQQHHLNIKCCFVLLKWHEIVPIWKRNVQNSNHSKHMFQCLSCCRFGALRTRLCTCMQSNEDWRIWAGQFHHIMTHTVSHLDVCVFAPSDGGAPPPLYTTVLYVPHSTAHCDHVSLTDEVKLFLLALLSLIAPHPQIEAKLSHPFFFPPQNSQNVLIIIGFLLGWLMSILLEVRPLFFQS